MLYRQPDPVVLDRLNYNQYGTDWAVNGSKSSSMELDCGSSLVGALAFGKRAMEGFSMTTRLRSSQHMKRSLQRQLIGVVPGVALCMPLHTGQ